MMMMMVNENGTICGNQHGKYSYVVSDGVMRKKAHSKMTWMPVKIRRYKLLVRSYEMYRILLVI